MTPPPTSTRALILSAGPQTQCGVGQFTLRLARMLEQREPGSTAALTLSQTQGAPAEIWRAVGSARNIVCNFPIVAWKRVILAPLIALLFARLRGRHVILVQHEWGSLHWLRRVTYLPAVLLASRIVMVSSLVRKELANDPLVGWTARKCTLAPLPPNIEAPADSADSELRRRLAEARAQGRLVIGHFGSIYPAKQPNALLAICATLKARGERPLVVYIGSFIRAMDNVEEDFYARARQLGVEDDVIVTGYVASDAEVFGLFSELDVFCYPLDEGITARRSSILAGVQSGKPLVVTGPAEADEFDHHPRFKALIDRGAIVPVARGAGAKVYADSIVAAANRPAIPIAFDFEGWWRDVGEAIAAEFTP